MACQMVNEIKANGYEFDGISVALYETRDGGNSSRGVFEENIILFCLYSLQNQSLKTCQDFFMKKN